MVETFADTTKPGESQTPSGDSEVAEFLSSIKLQKYGEKFAEQGIDDLSTLMELKDNHLESLGLPLGHKLKILKKIKELKAA